jgi:electron transport complex protein RnfB
VSSLTPEQVDEVLPQTQCNLCGFGGCMPYAEAMVFENAAINLCPPGGIKTLNDLGALLQKDPQPFLTDMQQKAKPPLVAVIRESECIGCTKCIQACPVDAIMGSAKLMHTIISAECTGCELCIPACPVDCIDLVATTETSITKEKSDHARKRFQTREKRLQQQEHLGKKVKMNETATLKKTYIQQALDRVKTKKMS